MPTAAVVVVGDVGRSPRTANHALSLAAEKGYDVCLIGYSESALNERIAKHPRIRVISLPSPPPLPILPELAALVWRFAWTAIMIAIALFFRVGWSLNVVLVQNPPALPALLVAWLAARLRCARFVIDWHNYTWSMLAERWQLKEESLGLERFTDSSETRGKKAKSRVSGGRARYVRATHAIEGWMGRAADASLCVSAAMAADLKTRWGVRAAVFYDRPPLWKFGEVSMADKHALFHGLARKENGELGKQLRGAGADEAAEVTLLTRKEENGEISSRNERPFLLISSTSWTPDEDFSILLEAVVQYETRIQEGDRSLPNLFLIITGKGPEKEYYMRKIEQLSLSHVVICAPWLEAADYPVAVASADLGVCLHTSTSGVDLPMKVVDMFGCGVPVLAKRFKAIGELVEEGSNGHLFDSADDLTELLATMARGHPGNNEALLKLRENLQSDKGRLRSWEETWKECTHEAFLDEKEDVFRRVIHVAQKDQ